MFDPSAKSNYVFYTDPSFNLDCEYNTGSWQFADMDSIFGLATDEMPYGYMSSTFNPVSLTFEIWGVQSSPAPANARYLHYTSSWQTASYTESSMTNYGSEYAFPDWLVYMGSDGNVRNVVAASGTSFDFTSSYGFVGGGSMSPYGVTKMVGLQDTNEIAHVYFIDSSGYLREYYSLQSDTGQTQVSTYTYTP
jgi:hypothetical protein